MDDFTTGPIHDVVVKSLTKFVDQRGWLAELFRSDELDSALLPSMGYISFTHPEVVRGPHEHRTQVDYFVFIGPSDFKVYLWDARPDSSTHGKRQTIFAGENSPCTVIVPPGVVHAYRNVGGVRGMVINLPNQLYAGKGKDQPVDEIRHENTSGSPYRID